MYQKKKFFLFNQGPGCLASSTPQGSWRLVRPDSRTAAWARSSSASARPEEGRNWKLRKKRKNFEDFGVERKEDRRRNSHLWTGKNVWILKNWTFTLSEISNIVLLYEKYRYNFFFSSIYLTIQPIAEKWIWKDHKYYYYLNRNFLVSIFKFNNNVQIYFLKPITS